MHSFHASKVNLNALVPIFASIKSPEFLGDSEVRILATCADYQFHLENMDEARIGVEFTPENLATYYLKLPIIFNNEERDPIAEPILRLKKIYFGKELELNDGQEYLLRYIIPRCHASEIQCEWS